MTYSCPKHSKKTKITDTKFFYSNTSYVNGSSEVHSEPCQTSKMKSFTKIDNGFFAKCSILEVLQGYEYTSDLRVLHNIKAVDQKLL